MNRVGIGYDVHRFKEGRRLVIGGVEIPHDKGLDGHSDADVLAHAVADALLGAIGEADIGKHFPVNDPRWDGIDSMVILDQVSKMVRRDGAQIVNVDATIIAQAPKMSPHIAMMKERMAEALHIRPYQIGIKATTNENLGFIGRGEGIAAMAVVSVLAASAVKSPKVKLEP
ncbi:MAG: 2-C-methyl-D-erythritol 2,4-cyclodiphosphate synthase [Verrucomicrobia bacterium]|nr:2-C-methyl-D-erythritol 2,4-cyclodiphosphate synthase [Verrucomicrobiota bacterium]